jgi:hypothetical protein
MKVKLKIDKWPMNADRHVVHWSHALPFVINHRGILIHRVRTAKSHRRHGRHSHDSVGYWCGNGKGGDVIKLLELPPADRLLCAYCEARAVAAGEPTADHLAGRHVHVGKLRAIRTCCSVEGN